MNNGDRVKIEEVQKDVHEMRGDLKDINLTLSNHVQTLTENIQNVAKDVAVLKTKVIIAFTIGGFIIGALVEYIMRYL